MQSDNSIDSGAITSRLRTLSAGGTLQVLVVDDDELERALICDRLEQRGLRVEQAADGAEALASLQREPVPVLLSDWMMPVMTGIELTERVRALGLVDTYIIMLTSKEGDFDFERGYQAGVDDYITKKVRDVELLARVHTGFSTWSLRRELREAQAALAASGAQAHTAQKR